MRYTRRKVVTYEHVLYMQANRVSSFRALEPAFVGRLPIRFIIYHSFILRDLHVQSTIYAQLKNRLMDSGLLTETVRSQYKQVVLEFIVAVLISITVQ